jgi:hypothetical protein
MLDEIKAEIARLDRNAEEKARLESTGSSAG